MTVSGLKNNIVLEKSQKEDLPEGWIKTTIENICTRPQYGWTTSSKKNGNVHLLRTTDITQSKINWDAVPYCKNEPADIDKYLLHDGDIVISRAGSVGVSYLVHNPQQSVFASYLIRFKPFINTRFFAYFLNTSFYWKEISKKSSGIAMANVNATKLKRIQFSLPPLSEQHRIVSKIESIFAQIDAMQKKLEAMASQIKSAPNSLDTLKNSILNQTFDNKSTKYKLVKLKDYLEDFEKRNPENEPNLSFKYVEIGGIGSNKKIINFKNLFGHNAPSRARNVIRVNDVIYGTTRPYYRNVVLVPSEFDNEVCSTGFCVLRSKHLVLLPAYLFYYMLSNTANEQILKFMRGGNYPAVSNTNVINIDIPLPPLPEQHRIVAKIESIFGRIDAIEEQVESSLIKLEQLKTTILKKAFEGKLVHQDPNDEPASVLLEKIKQEKSQIHKK